MTHGWWIIPAAIIGASMWIAMAVVVVAWIGG